MKAIILAAGRGSRINELTRHHPKCFTSLHGKTLLEWQLEALQEVGINEIAIVRGYLGEQFKQPLTYFENPEWQTTNMVSSLYCAREWLQQETCIVSYSDIVYSARSVSRLLQLPANANIAISYDPDWLTLWQMRFENPLEDAETFRLHPDDSLSAIGDRAKTIEEIEGQYMGLLRFTPKGWGEVESFLEKSGASNMKKMDMTTLLNHLLIDNQHINTVPIYESWYEVDSFQDLLRYQQIPRSQFFVNGC